MHARLVSITGAKDIDSGIGFLREKVIPLLNTQDGYRGASASADRDNGVVGVLSLWETAEARDATEGAFIPLRAEAVDIIGGELTVETFEQFIAEIGQRPPAPGSSLMVTRITMTPEAIDDNVEYFKTEVLPKIKATSGFQAARAMGNRDNGEGLVGTAWDDAESMRRAAEDAQSRRPDAIARGINFGDVSFREILLVDLK
jgi:heme-degrading monooxygenase HmoA